MKRYVFLIILTLYLTSCVASQETLVTPPASIPTSVTAVPTNAPLTPTPAKKIVVKQNDLIFIEFFAVT